MEDNKIIIIIGLLLIGYFIYTYSENQKEANQLRRWELQQAKREELNRETDRLIKNQEERRKNNMNRGW